MPYNKSPITTVGNAIKVFRQVINIFLPKNLFKAIIIPNGMAIKEAIRTANNETFKEVITILRSESSKLKIRLKLSSMELSLKLKNINLTLKITILYLLEILIIFLIKLLVSILSKIQCQHLKKEV